MYKHTTNNVSRHFQQLETSGYIIDIRYLINQVATLKFTFYLSRRLISIKHKMFLLYPITVDWEIFAG